jgi:hypothetical protein
LHRQVDQNNAKLIATEPRYRVFVANHLREPFSDVFDKPIAHRMTETVIDRLEPIQVQQQDREIHVGILATLLEQKL